MLAIVHKDELEEYIKLVEYVMADLVRQHWPWIILGLKVEIEVGDTWANKMSIEKWREKCSA